MKQWLLKILNKRIGRFLFVFLGIILSSGTILGYFNLILHFSIKYGTWISILFLLPLIIGYAFYASKKGRLFK